jgi:hypothetical protein
MIRRRKLLEIGAESPALGARFVSPLVVNQCPDFEILSFASANFINCLPNNKLNPKRSKITYHMF